MRSYGITSGTSEYMYFADSLAELGCMQSGSAR